MNKVAEIIKAEINATGTMSFARFMELALYCPEYGYYEKIEDRIGRRGDFYTSVSVGPLFGQLLAVQFADRLNRLSSRHSAPTLGTGAQRQNRLCIVEGGAHDGQLALDILRWLRDWCPDLWGNLSYYLIEPSEARRALQHARLAEVLGRVAWFPNFQGLRSAFPAGTFKGVVFSNELMDAMPVRVYRWNKTDASWWEWGVAIVAGSFDWVPLRKGSFPFPELIGERGQSGAPMVDVGKLCDSLPDGFTVEVSDAAVEWWGRAAECIDDGYLLTLDYGLEVEEILSPLRRGGTLRSYRQHRLCEDVLSDPGEQDITAHVNFSALAAAGTARGLRTLGIRSQAQFLTTCAAVLWREWPEAWSSESTRQLQTLTHPEHLGRAFRALVQARGAACQLGDFDLARS